MWIKIGRLTKLVAFILLLTVLLGGVYKVLSWKDTTGGYLSSVSQLYNTEDNLIDVVFLGSSHCYCSIYPAYMWQDAGISAFDMAISGQDKATTYHALIETLKTQSPKIVCVEMYGLLYDKHTIAGNAYRNMISMKTSKNSIELIKEYVDKEEQADYIAKWPIVHTRYKELDKYDYIQNELNVYGRGAFFTWEQYDGDIWLGGSETDQVGELSETNLEWLEKLYALSVEKNFDLIFFVAPFQINEWDQKIINAGAQYAAEREIPFFDFNKQKKEVGIDTQFDFCDGVHCNAKGAQKLTAYFTQYFNDAYQLADHRGDARYESWDKDLQWFHQLEDRNALMQTEDAAQYLTKIKEMDNVVAVLSLEAEFYNKGDCYYNLMEIMGVSREECGAGGKWIFRNNSIDKIMENDADSPAYFYDLSDTDMLKVQFVDDLEPSNIMINLEEYAQPHFHLTVVTYDTLTDEVIESRGF